MDRPSTPTNQGPFMGNTLSTPRKKAIRTLYNVTYGHAQSALDLPSTKRDDPMPFRAFSNGVYRTFTPDEAEDICQYFDCAILDMRSHVIIEDPQKNTQDKPFLVGGKIAIFHKSGESLPFGVGPPGQLIRPPSIREVDLSDPEAHRNLLAGGIPEIRTFNKLDEIYPGAEHISWINGHLLFEFPKVDPAEHRSRVQNLLPQKISGCIITVMNGPLLLNTMSHQITPDPTFLEEDKCYITNYLPEDLQPGVMLSGIVDGKVMLTTSGVLVENGQGCKRLTVSEHGFRASSPGIYHPDMNDAYIGDVVQRLGFDVALADLQPTISYTNRKYFEAASPIRRLALSSELGYGQRYELDSFTTGLQSVLCVGVRTGPRPKPPRFPLPTRPPPPSPSTSRRYLVVEQGIFSTDAKEITSEPKIRAGACGSPLVCVDSGVMNGCVGGFSHWVDIEGAGETILCYCEICDDLVDDGWVVAH